MNKPLQIGITGGIGSGKTMVCRVFMKLGIPVYDADHRAKSLMTTDGILITQIKKEFGDLSFDKEGRLNRQYLAELVFANPEKLEKLNHLVHPRVAIDYQTWVEENSHVSYVLKEAALLYESGSFKQMDKIIVVYAPAEVRMKRVLSRDRHRTQGQIEEIMKRQWPEEEKLKRADFVIHNDERELLIPQVLALHNKFKGLSF